MANFDLNAEDVFETANELRIREWENVEKVKGYDILADINNGKASFRSLDESLIDESSLNARVIYNQEKVQSLAASIVKEGQLVPVLVVENGDRYTLIGGHYRLKAIRAAGLKKVQAMVYPEGSISDQDIYAYSYRENADRVQQTAIDNALVWNKLLKDGLYQNETELAERIGVSKSNVNKTLSLLELPEDVVNFIKDQPDNFGLSIVYELVQYSRLVSDLDVMAVAKKIANKEITRDGIALLRNKLKAKKENPSRKNNKSHTFNLSFGANQATVKKWETGKIEVGVEFANEEDQEHFMAYLAQYKLNS